MDRQSKMTMNNAKNNRAAWLRGGDAECDAPPKPVKRPRRLVLLGAPGSGKGTQAELLVRNLGGCHLSTGDIFRTASCSEDKVASPAVREALDAMAKGELVRDETVLDMVRERAACLRCGGGVLLDGFPRTVAQADALADFLIQQNLRLDAVINFELPIDTIVRRLGGRRTCSDCRAVFHTESHPPREEGVCDHCGGALLQRDEASWKGLLDNPARSTRARIRAKGRTGKPYSPVP